MTQKMEKMLTDPKPKLEYQEGPLTNTDGQTNDRLIEINSSLIRNLQDAWQKRWNRLPNQNLFHTNLVSIFSGSFQSPKKNMKGASYVKIENWTELTFPT